MTPGFAALSPGARGAGRAAAGRAAAALAAELGGAVEIRGLPLPAPPAPASGTVRLGLELEALPATGLLEVEASLAIGLVDLLAGGPGEGPALSLTPVERSALELLALVALSGAAQGDVAERLAPRLSPPGEASPGSLAVDLAVAAGAARGRGRLLLPAPAVRALAGRGELPPAVAAWIADGWARSGSVALSQEEVASLTPGDVVLLDEPPADLAEVRLLGLRLLVRETEGIFHLEEIAMTDAAASLPIALAVEIARVSLTLGDLSRLEPGAALPLHAPRDGRVTLRLGERPVAAGRLVEIEGALGVLLDRIEAAP